MSSFVLLFLLCLSLLALILRKLSIGLVMLSLTLLWFLFVGMGFFPQTLLKELQTQKHQISPEWKSNNLIILLGGGKEKWPGSDEFTTESLATSRQLEAAKLYNSCKKQLKSCHILVSGGDPTHQGISEAEVLAQSLIALGVPDTDIFSESKSNNTFQNAQFSAALIAADHFDQIFLVSSGTHLNRALILFSHFGIEALPAPSDSLEAKISLGFTSRNFYYADVALHEFGGILQFYLYNLVGLNGKT